MSKKRKKKASPGGDARAPISPPGTLEEAAALWTRAVELLAESIQERLGDEGLKEGIEAFPVAVPSGGLEERWLGLFHSWLTHDFVSTRLGKTLAEHLLEDPERKVPADVEAVIRDAHREPLTFWQLEALETTGVRARDLFTDQVRFVSDPGLAESVRPGVLVFGRVVRAAGLTILDGYGPYPLPGGWGAPMRDAMLSEAGLPHPARPVAIRLLGTPMLVLYAQAASQYLELAEAEARAAAQPPTADEG